ncbi:MAG: response regulator, partial [Phycisphaeraceae bacterium]|nr:response regulator [Phycisphaeraceae bacterium]
DSYEVDPTQFSGTVLVAEDVEGNQRLMTLMLSKLGLDVVIAENGQQVVEKALAQSFDMILMDMQMPLMNGYEATRLLKQQGYKAPILALTANAMKGDERACIEAGCDGFLAKPIDRSELTRVLARYMPATMNTKTRAVGSDPAQVPVVEAMGAGQSVLEAQSREPKNGDVRKIINWDRLIERMGDEETIREIMPVYTKDIQGHSDKLSQAIKNGDFDSMVYHAHALKGVGRNLSIEHLADIASQIEKAGRENELEAGTLLFNDLKSEVDNVVAVLSQCDWTETVSCVPTRL